MTPSQPQRRFFCDGRAIWFVETIWTAAEGLASEEVAIDDVRDFDEVCWFSDAWGKRPTCRAVVEHCMRMNAADTSFPIILGPKGELLDGMHRIGRAAVEGLKTVQAIHLRVMPPADEHLNPDDPRYQAAPTTTALDDVSIEPMHIREYDEVLAHWQEHSAGMGLNESDTREAIGAYLDRNPGLSLVARSSGKIIGGVLCGHDGRRGFLHHLGVTPGRRRSGIATAMVDRCIAALAALKVPKCNVFVFSDNTEGAEFWTNRGFSPREDLRVLQRRLVGLASE